MDPLNTQQQIFYTQPNTGRSSRYRCFRLFKPYPHPYPTLTPAFQHALARVSSVREYAKDSVPAYPPYYLANTEPRTRRNLL